MHTNLASDFSHVTDFYIRRNVEKLCYVFYAVYIVHRDFEGRRSLPALPFPLPLLPFLSNSKAAHLVWTCQVSLAAPLEVIERQYMTKTMVLTVCLTLCDKMQ